MNCKWSVAHMRQLRLRANFSSRMRLIESEPVDFWLRTDVGIVLFVPVCIRYNLGYSNVVAQGTLSLISTSFSFLCRRSRPLSAIAKAAANRLMSARNYNRHNRTAAASEGQSYPSALRVYNIDERWKKGCSCAIREPGEGLKNRRREPNRSPFLCKQLRQT